MKSILYYFFVLLFVACFISCNKYLDASKTEKKIPIYNGYLACYNDSNIFVFRSNIGIKTDKQYYGSKPFYTQLPKGLLSYQIENNDKFVFYYDKKQAISISINLKDSSNHQDNTYEPKKDEIEEYKSGFASDIHRKFNLPNIEYISRRKQLIIIKGQASIFLYNIEIKNIELFIKRINQFRFL